MTPSTDKTITLTQDEARLVADQLSFRIRELEGVLQSALEDGDTAHADNLMRAIPKLRDVFQRLID